MLPPAKPQTKIPKYKQKDRTISPLHRSFRGLQARPMALGLVAEFGTKLVMKVVLESVAEDPRVTNFVCDRKAWYIVAVTQSVAEDIVTPTSVQQKNHGQFSRLTEVQACTCTLTVCRLTYVLPNSFTGSPQPHGKHLCTRFEVHS